MMAVLFGEVRAVFGRDDWDWMDVVDALDGYDESTQRAEFLEGMLPYLERELEVLEDEERVLPDAWVEPCARWGRFAPCRLVRRLVLEERPDWADSLGTILGSGDLLELRALKLPRLEGVSKAFLGTMVVPKIEALDLGNLRPERPQLMGLMENPNVGRVRDLNLGWHHMGESVAVAMLSSSMWGAVESLFFEGNGLEESTAVERVLLDPGMNAVTELWLGWNDIGVAGACALAQAPYLSNLEILGLENNSLETDSTASMLKSIRGESLRELRLYHGELGPEVARAIASNPSMCNLEVLDLDETLIDEEGCEALLASTSLPASVLQGMPGWTRWSADE